MLTAIMMLPDAVGPVDEFDDSSYKEYQAIIVVHAALAVLVAELNPTMQ